MLYAVPTGIFPQRLLKLVKKVCFPFCVSECFKIKINTNKIKEEGAEEQGGFTGKKVLVTCAYIYIYIYMKSWSLKPSRKCLVLKVIES